MAPLPAKPRQRAWKPKNRTGCKTCKIRKVKCDEEKPHCKRCTSTGRTCDGYDPTFRPSPPSTLSPPGTAWASPQAQIHRGLIRSHSPAYLIPALRLNTLEERESFDFFTSHAILSLRGFLDSPFWQREVLQAAHRDTAIQHCVIALGAMHRRFFEGNGSHLKERDMSDKYLQFALRQSNRAIQDLVRKQDPCGRIARTDKVTLMTCSVLFSSMCCLQGYQKDALEHLRSGIRMLNEMDDDLNDKDRAEAHPIDIESLRSIFVGLDMQARSIMPSYQSKTWVTRPKTKKLLTLPGSELNMTSLLAVLRYMESLLNHIHSFFQGSLSRPADEFNDMESEYNNLNRRFDQGAAILDTLWKKAAAFGDEFTQPLTALELLLCQIQYLLGSPRSDQAVRFKFMSDFHLVGGPFKEPIDLAAHFVRMFELATRLLPISSSVAPVFTTTNGPLSALWLVAMRAPSSCQALRKRATKLMLSHPRREGFWDAMVAGQVAAEALGLEQESTRAALGLFDSAVRDLVVPEDLRIITVVISYPEDDDRKARVEFSDSRDLAIGVPGAVRWISW